jgi:response regulator RpfG family c-di-GMP phosphodiesterase
MRLSSREIDDIRVAALLMDMENIEITARVIKKAVGALEDDTQLKQRTFHGTELVQSLGTVLTGAFPLLLNTSEEAAAAEGHSVPFGARIIRTVRAYEAMESDPWQHGDRSPESFVDELQSGIDIEHHPAVLHALRLVVTGREASAAPSTSA